MDILVELLSFSNVILALAVTAVVWVKRKAMELSVKKLTQKGTKINKWWTEFFVPMMPIGTGGLLMLIPGVPAPEMFSGSLGAKMVFGVFIGLISGLVYRLVKKNLFERLGKEEEAEYLEEKSPK